MAKTAQTAQHKKKFLQNFSKFCVIGTAAEATGISRRVVYDWLEKDKQFKSDFEDARQ